MTKLLWDGFGTRFYEAGVSKGVLYVDDTGVAWSGLASVDETPSGGDPKSFYLDGVMYLMYSAREEFSATISAYYSPREFDACEGIKEIHPGLYTTQQRRKSFGFSYRTRIGNDVDGTDHGYKIHIVYNALAAVADRKHGTLKENTDVSLLSWLIAVKPVSMPGAMRSAHLVIDTTSAPDFAISQLEDILYGTDFADPRLPTPDEVAAIFEGVAEFTVTDLGSGRFSIAGSSFEVAELDVGAGIWQITQDGVTPVDSDSWTITS
jgi:hypothetical protein